MNRRRVIGFVAVGVFGSRVLAQPANKVWRVGFLALTPLTPQTFDPFRAAMREVGYVEGRNLVIEWRSAEGDLGRLPTLAAELVQLKVDVICAAASGAIAAAQKATSTIPIVMTTTGDPVGSGFVRSLSHPGGNITGLSNMNADVAAKLVEIAAQIVPNLGRLGVLVTPTSTTARAIKENVASNARNARIALVVAEASTAQEIDDAFAMLGRERVEALIVGAAPYFATQRERIVRLALRQRLPAIYGGRGYVEAGGLIGYGQSSADQYKRVAVYVDKILRGANPGDLPVEQPKSFELGINQRAARAIGLTFPKEILLRADYVIE